MAGPHLFIDGRNSVYRAIYANQNANTHNIVVMLRFIRKWIENHQPTSIHVFWDAPRKTVWRKKLLSTYKERDKTREIPGRNVQEELVSTQNAAYDLFMYMNIRQYLRKCQEADDLIYAACRVVFPNPVIVVSSDGDFLQIPYFMPNVRVYEPRVNKFADVPKCNPVVQKALMGDDGDKINGYDGIGPVKSAALAESIVKTHEFTVMTDRALYMRNLLLIDLALCPHLLANQLYVSRIMSTSTAYDKNQLAALIGKHHIIGLLNEFQKLVLPFKNIGVDETPA